MHHCREKFTVIGFAVSGTREEISTGDNLLSTFILRQSKVDEEDGTLQHFPVKPLSFNNAGESLVDKLLPFDQYLTLSEYDPQYAINSRANVAQTKKEVSSFTRAYDSDIDRALTLSSLVALKDETLQQEILNNPVNFSYQNIEQAYDRIMGQGRADELQLGIRQRLNKLDDARLISLSTKLVENIVHQQQPEHSKISLEAEFIEDFLNFKMSSSSTYVSKGQIKTPKHIYDLMSELAQLKETDRILDITCGTGTMLQAAFQNLKSRIDPELVGRNPIFICRV